MQLLLPHKVFILSIQKQQKNNPPILNKRHLFQNNNHYSLQIRRQPEMMWNFCVMKFSLWFNSIRSINWNETFFGIMSFSLSLHFVRNWPFANRFKVRESSNHPPLLNTCTEDLIHVSCDANEPLRYNLNQFVFSLRENGTREISDWIEIKKKLWTVWFGHVLWHHNSYRQSS